MRAILAILAIGSAHGLAMSKSSLRSNTCEIVKPSGDAKFDSERPGNPKSITEKYSISVCRKSDLEGEFRITKLHNCKKETMNFAITEGLAAEVKQRMGQDEFFLSLEGPEVRALHPTPSDSHANCEYVMPYKLTVPGKYHVNLVWMRENYAAITETAKVWPEGHLDLPLGTATFLQFGPDTTAEHLEKARTGEKCNYKLPSTSRAGRWVFKGEDPKQLSFKERRARCVDQDLKEDKLVSEKCTTWIHAYVDYKDYEWIPDSCQPRRFSKEEARQCLSKNTLLISGDSHLRHLYGAIAGYACDMDEVIKGMGAYHSACVSSAKANACSKLPKNTLCYRQDYFGIGQPQPKLENFNLTVVNFGQHQADGAHQQTLAKFKQGVSSYSSQLAKQLPANQGKFAWHETNANPFRMDHYVKSYKDWRTYQRLQLYNEVTTKEFENLGVPIIPSYESTYDFSLHSDDPAHYPQEVLTAQVQNILGLLCE